jgi:hypothetical protein
MGGMPRTIGMRAWLSGLRGGYVDRQGQALAVDKPTTVIWVALFGCRAAGAVLPNHALEAGWHGPVGQTDNTVMGPLVRLL